MKICNKTFEVEAQYDCLPTGIEIELTCTPDSIWCPLPSLDGNENCYNGFDKDWLVAEAAKTDVSFTEAYMRFRHEYFAKPWFEAEK